MLKKYQTIKLIWKTIKITGLIVAPIILLILPANYFDTGESICISKRLFDVECHGCGLTRAIMHLIHFDFQEAWSFNKLSFIALPVLVLLWIKFLLNEFGVKILKWF